MEDKLYKDIYQWLYLYKKNSVKLSTFDRLETSYKLLLRYSIASVRLDKLTEDMLQGYINELVSDGYSLSTIHKQYHLLTAFLEYALVKGLIFRPIHKAVQLPSRQAVKKRTKDIYAYTAQEQARLRAVLDTGEMTGYLAALFMMETGMRVGECLALGWNDIDWFRRSITISKTFVRLGNRNEQFVQDGAKSFASNRTIPMSTAAADILTRAWQTRASDFVFHNEDGEPLSYEAMRYQITKACNEAGVRYLGLHVFRHTFATNCYNRGCDVKILSKLLGHADVSVTYNTYIHLFGDNLEAMRKIFA